MGLKENCRRTVENHTAGVEVAQKAGVKRRGIRATPEGVTVLLEGVSVDANRLGEEFRTAGWQDVLAEYSARYNSWVVTAWAPKAPEATANV